MLVVVLTENKGTKTTVFINNRERVELVVPNNIVSFLKGCSLGSGYKLFKRSHKGTYLFVAVHTAYAVVTAGNNTDKLAFAGTVFGNGNGRVTGTFLKLQNVGKSLVRSNIRVAFYKAGFVSLYSCDHSGFVLNRLGAVDERNATLLSQSNRQAVVRYSLHDSGNKRHIH